MRARLDQTMAKLGLASTRSQAENLIKLGKVMVDGQVVKKPALSLMGAEKIEVAGERYVSRAGLKLASIAARFGLDFADKTVLDVGSSTGGFTDYALQHGARKVIAVDVGTGQLHPSLRQNPQVELHEKTDIRDFTRDEKLDLILLDVSFISSREILPHLASELMSHKTQLVLMLKPQFETGEKAKNSGVIKNDTARRLILKDFELWARSRFVTQGKSDSAVAGRKGNLERFYLLGLIHR